MDAIYDWLLAIHTDSPHLLKALLAGTLVSTVCGVIGCFIILRRTAFLADALAHSMLAGVVCGYLIMKVVFKKEAHAPAMLLGSVIAGILTVVMIGLVSRFSRVKEDAVIGLMYTGIFALGGVLLSLFSRYVHVDLYHFIMGELLGVSNGDLWMMAIVTVVVLSVVILLFRQLQLISFDRVMAASIGVPVLLLDYVLTTCTSLVVVSGVHIVGVILVVGLLITPAATAYLLCDRLSRMLVVAALFGWTSFLIGYVVSEQINVAPGSAVVVASAAQFMIVFQFAPKYGFLADWRRRRRAVPQQLLEDVLGCLLRAPGKTVAMSTVLEHVRSTPASIRRAVRSLQRDQLLDRSDTGLTLTKDGRLEARRLLRAHRLWESYLEHVGTPGDKLHDAAHLLEHVHDEATVDYLDDMLGHPLRDPHGAEIPEDFVHLVPGQIVKVALLRSGHEGRIADVGDGIGKTSLRPGMHVVAQDRQDAGQTWVLKLPDGQLVRLNHSAADDISVELDAK